MAGDRLTVLQLTFPSPAASAKISAEVCWRNDESDAGPEFVRVPALAKE